MGKRKRKSRKTVKIMSFVLVILVIVAIIIFQQNRKDESKSDVSEVVESTQEQEGLIYPYILEDEELEIVSVFSYSGTNPDFDDEECENVGAVQVINQSEEYLEQADIVVTLSDGSKLQFLLEEIPAGKEVMAFEINNAEYNQVLAVMEIQADVKRTSEKKLDKEAIKYEIGEEEITLTNVLDTEILDITVKYHCSLNEMYFGGKSFVKVVEALQPDESAIVDASECYLGEVTVVDITY